jgi:hypothetical protein
MAQQYLPGQLWISDSEAELGLGTILTQDGRMLTVLYPATGETDEQDQAELEELPRQGLWVDVEV